MATQKMSVEQLHEYVRAQERDVSSLPPNLVHSLTNFLLPDADRI